MSTLAAYTWRQIADRNLTPTQRHEMAWNMWREAGSDATYTAAVCSSVCMAAAVYARGGGSFGSYDPDPVETALLARDRVLEVGSHAWNCINAFVTSGDMDFPDPTLDEQVEHLSTTYQGDAGFMLGYYGKAAIGDFATTDPEGFAARYQWVQSKIEELGVELFPTDGPPSL